METRRLFLAIPVPAAVRQVLQDVQEDVAAVFGPKGRVHPDSLHLTLRFLGDVPAGQINELSEAVRTGLANTEPLKLRLGGVTTFGPIEAPRVVVVTVVPESPVAVLAGAVEQVVTEMGFKPEKRPFRAHITIHRPKSRGRILPRTLPDGEPFLVDRVVLYESKLRPDRAHYIPVAAFPLGADRAGDPA